MKRTRVAYVIGSLDFGGAEQQLLELLRHIDRERFWVSLVLFHSDTASRAAGLADEIFSLGIASRPGPKAVVRGSKAAGAMLRLAGYFRRIKPDIVQAILPASCILAAPAAKLAGVPVVIAARRSLVDCYRTNKLFSILDRFATRSCDYAIGNSEAIRSELMEIDGLNPERVGLIYNGVDINRFRPGDRGLRKHYGWAEENVVFGIVANFLPYKRHADFIQAAALIAESDAKARFLMAGEDRGVLGSLGRQIEAVGLQSRFTIIPGTTEPERLYPALDVYICTSQSEGLSNVLLEAGACGLPVIATRVGGNAEIIVDGYNGFLVPPAAPERIAAKALELGSDPELRALLGARARQRVISQFSIPAMVRAHEELYEKLLQCCAKHQRSDEVNATATANI
jgi:glycosyltransferase involved in cell wall biosynthesis